MNKYVHYYLQNFWYCFWIACDEVVQAAQDVQGNQVDPVAIPIGPMMGAHTKKLNESFQTMVWAIQDSVGMPSTIKETNEESLLLVNLTQVTRELDAWRSNYPIELSKLLLFLLWYYFLLLESLEANKETNQLIQAWIHVCRVGLYVQFVSYLLSKYD